MDPTSTYIRDVFGKQPADLAAIMTRAEAAGLPRISVAPEVGRFLSLLASTTNDGRGASVAIEIGTLAGYSAVWIASGLAQGGRLITIEADPKHRDVAVREIARAGLSGSVEVRLDRGIDALDKLADEYNPGDIDFIFIDALKTEYPAYVERAIKLVGVGGMIVLDNALGSNSWSIDIPAGTDESRDAVDRANRMLAAHPSFTASCVPLGHGLTIARRIRAT